MGFHGPLLLERATWRAPLALTPHSESLARSVAGSVRQGQTLLQRRWPKAPLDRASKNPSAAVAMRRAASLETKRADAHHASPRFIAGANSISPIRMAAASGESVSPQHVG